MSSEDEGKLKSIFHDPDYYAKAFDEYAKLSSKYQVLSTWADTVFPREVVDTLASNSTDHKEPLKILGVGSGTGAMDFKMVDQLSTRFPVIHNTILEPAEEHINKYKTRATAEGYDRGQWEWRQQTWDEFQKDRRMGDHPDSGGFHFISAIHSLYYVDDLETAVMDMVGCLEDGGLLMVITVADHSGFWRLWQRFRTTVTDGMFSPSNSGSVRDILARNGLEFKVIPQESAVDITSCYKEGDKIGMMVADFLLHVVNLHRNAPPDFVEEVMAYLGGPECSVRNGGRIFFNNDWDAILVKKE